MHTDEPTFQRNRVRHPDRIPASRYYDRDFFELERRKLWPRVWQMACRLEELRENGDFVEYQLLDQSYIVVRVGPDTVKAYENACRHRGVRLCNDRGNARAGFSCPFHGWRWNAAGDCEHIVQSPQFAPETIRKSDVRLTEVRCETWGGCVFINPDPEAAPLRASLGRFAPMHEARNVDQLRAKFWIAVRSPANWKATMEAFMESYHVSRTHPQLMAMLNAPADSIEAAARGGARTALQSRYASYRSGREVAESTIEYLRRLGEGMGWSMVIERDVEVMEKVRDTPLPDDPAEAGAAWRRLLNDAISKHGREAGLPMPDLNAIPGELESPVNFAFPNFFLLPYFGNMACYRIRPLDAETSVMEIWGLEFFPPGEEPPPLRTPEMLEVGDPAIPLIPSQDFAVLARQQQGLRARGFEELRLASRNEGLISNYQRLIDGYLGDASRDALLRAVAKVSGPIDATITEIGLPAT